MIKNKKRYQNQPWYMKLYLSIRYNPRIPFVAIKIWWAERKEDDPDWKMNFRECYSVARGLADADKNHLYDWDDIDFPKDSEND